MWKVDRIILHQVFSYLLCLKFAPDMSRSVNIPALTNPIHLLKHVLNSYYDTCSVAAEDV